MNTEVTKELDWESLKDPNVLHINLLRGFPARLKERQLIHLIGSNRMDAIVNEQVSKILANKFLTGDRFVQAEYMIEIQSEGETQHYLKQDMKTVEEQLRFYWNEGADGTIEAMADEDNWNGNQYIEHQEDGRLTIIKLNGDVFMKVPG